MMAANITKSARTPRDIGLIFDWENRRTPRLAKLGMLAAAVAIFILPLMLVRINVGVPPVQETQSAAMMLLTPGNDPMHWLDAARALGPFPTRFDPADWESGRAQVEEVLDGVRERSIPPHQPRYQDLPAEPVPPSVPLVPLVAKGSRVLPAVASPEFRPILSIQVRPTPVLYPLSVDAGELPESSPPFDAEVTPEMASQPWRFLLQISPDGAVLHAVALIGHNTPGRTSLTAWLQAHRFPGLEMPHDRWVAVAVTFQNQPADGTDDP